MTVTKSSSIASNGNLIYPSYSVVVDSNGGGQYTDISTAFSEEGATSYYITGSFIESSANLTIPTDSIIYFDNVELAINGYKLTTGNNAFAYGHLTLTGTGDTSLGASSRNRMFGQGGVYNDFGGLTIDFEPSFTSCTGAAARLIELGGWANDLGHLRLLNWTTYNDTDDIDFITGFDGVKDIRAKVTIYNWDSNAGANLTGVKGAGFDQCVFNINMDTIDGGSGKGKGVEILAGCNYNSFVGTIRGCASANIANSAALRVGFPKISQKLLASALH